MTGDPIIHWLSVSAYARQYGIDRTTVTKWLLHKDVLISYRVGLLVRIKNQPPQEEKEPKA